MAVLIACLLRVLYGQSDSKRYHELEPFLQVTAVEEQHSTGTDVTANNLK